METRMTEQRRAEIKTHIEGQLAVDCCCCAFGDELLSELKAVEAMFRLKQDDWIEACREVDQLREIAKKLVGAIATIRDKTIIWPKGEAKERLSVIHTEAQAVLTETAEARKAMNL